VAEPFLFSEDGALLKSHIVMQHSTCWNCRYRGRRQLAVASYCLRSFSTRPQGGSVSRFKSSSPLYPRYTSGLKRLLATTVLGSQKDGHRMLEANDQLGYAHSPLCTIGGPNGGARGGSSFHKQYGKAVRCSGA